MKTPPTPTLRDCDRELVQALAGRLQHRRTVDVIGGFYNAPEVQQQLGDRDSQTCERLAYMSGLVVAEVSMRRSAPAVLGRLVACIAVVVLLAGCNASRTRINPGADLAVYEASPQWIWENLPRKYGQRILGFYDPSDGSVTIDKTLSPWGKATVFSHETIGHGWDHQQPRDGWELLSRYHSPAFQLLTHPQDEIDAGRAFMEQFPDPMNTHRAMETARQAAAEVAP